MSAPTSKRGPAIDAQKDGDAGRLNVVILDDDKATQSAHAKADATVARPLEFVREEEDLSPPPASEVANSNAKSRSGRFTLLHKGMIGSGLAVLLVAAAGFAYHYVTIGRFIVTTDDAYVRAHNTTLAAKVSGYVARMHVEDNTLVRTGDLIASIDDGDYRLSATAARDKVETQEATVERIGKQVLAQQANVNQAQAQLAGSQAGSRRASQELNRQRALSEIGRTSTQSLEQVQANHDQALAGVQNANAVIEAALANVEVLRAQQEEAQRTLKELRTMQAKAERELSFAEIRAPINGVISNRAVQVGDFVDVGQRVANVVPLDDVYIIANFKETQLARLVSGQPVSIKVDALPGRVVNGTVVSVSPASGAVFSLLPPDNATGNFTKIVQRLPVRIRIPADVAAEGMLRPGMSVVVSVNTRSETETAGGLASPARAGEAQPRTEPKTQLQTQPQTK